MSNLFKKYFSIIQERTNVNLNVLKKIRKDQENLDSTQDILTFDEISRFEDFLKDDNKKIVIILVGLPATGKTTLTRSIKRLFGENETLLIDRDQILTDSAKEFGLTFDDLFIFPRDVHEKFDHPKYGKWLSGIPSRFGGWEKVHQANIKATTKLNQMIFNSVNTDKKVILIDNLNINVMQRKKIINLFQNKKESFYTIAVVTVGDLKNENIIRNKKLVTHRTLKSFRSDNPIVVPPSIIDLASSKFEQPSKSEGFDLILNINNIDRIFTKLLKRKINIDQLIEDSPLEKSLNNSKIQKFINLINKTDFNRQLNFNSGFEEHFSNPLNINNQNSATKEIIKIVKIMYPKIRDILINNGYPRYKPIDAFLKEFDAFYGSNFRNIIYFYENH